MSRHDWSKISHDTLTTGAAFTSSFPPVAIWLGSLTFSSLKKVDDDTPLWGRLAAVANVGAATNPMMPVMRTSRRWTSSSVERRWNVGLGAKAWAEATRAARNRKRRIVQMYQSINQSIDRVLKQWACDCKGLPGVRIQWLNLAFIITYLHNDFVWCHCFYWEGSSRRSIFGQTDKSFPPFFFRK